MHRLGDRPGGLSHRDYEFQGGVGFREAGDLYIYQTGPAARFDDARPGDFLLALWIDYPDRSFRFEGFLERAQFSKGFVGLSSQEDQVGFFGCPAFDDVSGAALHRIGDAD